MRAVKGNKVYTITEVDRLHYQEEGYDILADNGKVIANGHGKTVPFEEYEKVRKKLEELKAKQAADSGKKDGK